MQSFRGVAPPKKEEEGSALKSLRPVKVMVADAILDYLLKPVGIVLPFGCSYGPGGILDDEPDAGEISGAAGSGINDAGGVDVDVADSEDAGSGTEVAGGSPQGADAGFADSGDTESAVEGGANTEAVYVWVPAHMWENGEPRRVLLGVESGSRYCNTHECFDSPQAIGEEVWEEQATVIRSVMEYPRFFFREDVFDEISGNNLFSIMPADWPLGGALMGKVMGYLLAEKDGQVFANCIDTCVETDTEGHCQQYEPIDEKCQDMDTLSFKETGSRVVFHELLHDAWFSHFTEDDRDYFRGNARVFFNTLGDSWQTDQLTCAIWRGQYYDPDILDEQVLIDLPFESNLEGPELGMWASEALPDMDEAEAEQLKNAMKQYFRTFEYVVGPRTRGRTYEQRDGFISIEGFAYIGANYGVLDDFFEHPETIASREPKLMPSFMGASYAKVIKPEYLEGLDYAGFGYFTSADAFREFSEYIRSFSAWMREKYPQLNEITK